MEQSANHVANGDDGSVGHRGMELEQVRRHTCNANCAVIESLELDLPSAFTIISQCLVIESLELDRPGHRHTERSHDHNVGTSDLGLG